MACAPSLLAPSARAARLPLAAPLARANRFSVFEIYGGSILTSTGHTHCECPTAIAACVCVDQRGTSSDWIATSIALDARGGCCQQRIYIRTHSVGLNYCVYVCVLDCQILDYFYSLFKLITRFQFLPWTTRERARVYRPFCSLIPLTQARKVIYWILLEFNPHASCYTLVYLLQCYLRDVQSHYFHHFPRLLLGQLTAGALYS